MTGHILTVTTFLPLVGVVLLLGTVWLATHLAVRIFTPKVSPSAGGTVV